MSERQQLERYHNPATVRTKVYTKPDGTLKRESHTEIYRERLHNGGSRTVIHKQIVEERRRPKPIQPAKPPPRDPVQDFFMTLAVIFIGVVLVTSCIAGAIISNR